MLPAADAVRCMQKLDRVQHLLGAHGTSEVVALRDIASELSKPLQTCGVFHTLGDDLKLERLAEPESNGPPMAPRLSIARSKP